MTYLIIPPRSFLIPYLWTLSLSKLSWNFERNDSNGPKWHLIGGLSHILKPNDIHSVLLYQFPWRTNNLNVHHTTTKCFFKKKILSGENFWIWMFQRPSDLVQLPPVCFPAKQETWVNLGSVVRKAKRKWPVPVDIDVVEDSSSNCKSKGTISMCDPAGMNALKWFCNMGKVKIPTLLL